MYESKSFNKKDAILRFIGVLALIILGAYFTLEINLLDEPIPITGQSLAIMVCCIFLKPIEAVAVVLVYLLLGCIGLPVFAGGSSGWEKIPGPTGGFLYGFVVVAFVISVFGKKGYTKTIIKAFVAMIVSTAILLLIGNAHLSFKIGIEKALDNAFYPFWKAGIIKAAIGTGLIMGWQWYLDLREKVAHKN